MQAPFVGNPIHYVARGSADGVFPPVCRAAWITEVPAHEVNDQGERLVLCAVLNPTGLFFQSDPLRLVSEPDAEGKFPGGTWHYHEDCYRAMDVARKAAQA